MKRLLAITAMVTIATSGAAARQAYQAASAAGAAGYFAAPGAQKGRYTIVYTGDRAMKRDAVARYALLRAAELTTESGFEWFAVLATSSQNVREGSDPIDLDAKGGKFVGSGSVSAGSGAQPAANGNGTRDADVSTGPDSGGFGGGAVPYQVLERWNGRSVYRTVLVIQMGSGNNASFEGAVKAPDIFSAKAVADEIRAKMTK